MDEALGPVPRRDDDRDLRIRGGRIVALVAVGFVAKTWIVRV
jgi:hypothetical protein